MKSAAGKTLFFMIAGLVTYVTLLFASVWLTRANISRTTLLAEHWDVQSGGVWHEDMPYENELVANELSFNGTVTRAIVLPDFGEPAFPTIYLQTRKSAIEVYLDGKKIYEGETDRVPGNRFIGRRVRFITLPQDYAGKRLEIRTFAVGEGGGIGIGYEAPRFGGYRACFMYYVQRYIPALLAATLLMLFGMIFFFISIFFFSAAPGQAAQIISSLVCIDFGIWTIGYFDLTRVFISERHTTIIEYLALYTLLPMQFLLIGHMYEKVKKLRIAGYAGIVAVGIVCALHSFNIVHADVFAPAYLLFSLAMFIVTVVMMLRRRRQTSGELDLNVQEMGLLMLLCSLILYSVIYILQSVTGMTEDLFTMYLPVIGTTSFVISQILYYFLHVSEAYARRKEFSALTHLAYVDVLTGLPNRKAAMNIFDNLDHTHTDYTILSLDLNGLKAVNDRYGHAEGDRLLKTTANVLNECFADIGFRARLSGDEFLVIIQRATKEVINERIRKMRDRFTRLSDAHAGVSYSIAVGSANKTEDQVSSAGEAFRIADERMYEEKQAYYGGKA